jgi:hypothetical protein
MTAGGLLHTLRFPFSGILLAAIGAGILACQRSLCPVRGITLTTGCIAAGIKIFSLGGVYLFALSAVLIEALLAEAIFCLLGASFFAAGLAGLLMGLWSFLQGFLKLLLLYGVDWIEASASALAGRSPSWPVSLLGLLFLTAFLLVSLPALGGLLGLWAARRMRGSLPGIAYTWSKENA